MGGNKDHEPKREIKWVKPGDLRPHPLNEKLYGDMSLAKDMDALRASVEECGILSALHATSDNVIISGHRRHYIALELGLPTVPVEYVRVEDPLDVEAFVIAANDQREKTLEAGIREFMQLKLIEAERGKQRQVQAPKRRGKTGRQETAGEAKVQENFPEDKGQARDLAAKRLGISGKSAEKAEDVVEAIDKAEADGDTERANLLREKLTKSIDAAYREVKGKPRKPRAIKPKAQEGEKQSGEAVTGRDFGSGLHSNESGGMTNPGQDGRNDNGPTSEGPEDGNVSASGTDPQGHSKKPDSDRQEMHRPNMEPETEQGENSTPPELKDAYLKSLKKSFNDHMGGPWSRAPKGTKRDFIDWLSQQV